MDFVMNLGQELRLRTNIENIRVFIRRHMHLLCDTEFILRDGYNCLMKCSEDPY